MVGDNDNNNIALLLTYYLLLSGNPSPWAYKQVVNVSLSKCIVFKPDAVPLHGLCTGTQITTEILKLGKGYIWEGLQGLYNKAVNFLSLLAKVKVSNIPIEQYLSSTTEPSWES